MITLKNMSTCEKGHLYPNRFDKCPTCHSDAMSKAVLLTPEQLAAAIANSLSRGDLDESQIKK